MEIQERVVDDVTILHLTGKIVSGDGEERLRERIDSVVRGGRKMLLLNLQDVPYVDSAGLGAIVRAYTTVTRQGGELKLLKPSKRIHDLLAIVKLLTVFEIFEDETRAVASFSDRRDTAGRETDPRT